MYLSLFILKLKIGFDMLNLKKQMDLLPELGVYMNEQLSFMERNIWMKNFLLPLLNLKKIKKK